MKAKPVKKNPNGNGMIECKATEATHIELNMPGPMSYRLLPVQIGGSRKDTPNWSWNGDVDNPTLKPSILIRQQYRDCETRCHSFVNDGKVQFLNDCSHDLRGQTLPLLEV